MANATSTESRKMTKIFLNVVLIFISIYWAGEAARQNPKINNFVLQLEKGYQSFNENLQEISILNGLKMLGRLYGWLAISSLFIIFLMSIFSIKNSAFAISLLFSFVASFFSWLSIKWVTEHKKTILEMRPQVVLSVFTPLIMGVSDWKIGTSFIAIFIKSLPSVPLLFGYEVTQDINPILFGLLISLLFLSLLLFYYFTIWIVAAILAFVSAVIISTPVFLARFIHVIAPRKAFFGFTALIFSIALLWQSWL
jgi:hypothetical protein